MPSSTDMKRLLSLFILMLCLFPFTACSSNESTNSPHSTNNNAPQSSQNAPDTSSPETIIPEVIVIAPDKAKEMIDQGNVIVVDVRRKDEFDAGHIEGAKLVPNETILEEAATALPDKSAVYLIYCRSGHRSNEAAHKLISLGYQNVYDFGGILSWEYGTVTE